MKHKILNFLRRSELIKVNIYLHVQVRIKGDVHSTQQGSARSPGGRRGPWVACASSAARPSCSPWSPRGCRRRWGPRAGTLRGKTLHC